MKNIKQIIQKNFHNDQIVPIILGGYVNGLGLVRSFGQKNIRSIVLDYDKTLAFYSKYATGIICPHPTESTQAFLDFLLELGKQLPSKGFLLTTNDIWLLPVSQNEKLLESYYIFPMSKWDVLEQCLDKSFVYGKAKEAKVPYPKTFQLKGVYELDSVFELLPFPCIVKPAITIGFKEKLRACGRTICVNDKKDFLKLKSQIIDAGLDHEPLVIQENIPGGAENLYTLTSYSNQSGDIIAYSVGHKIRQNPPDAGTILSGRVVPDETVFELGKRLIKSVGFHGIANTEFKKDPRDGSYQLIEINPRPGMWNSSVLASGINLPYLAYCERVLGEHLEFMGSSPNELVWLVTLLDLFFSIYGFKKYGYKEFSISFKEWCRSLKGKKVDAIWSLSDINPFIYDLFSLFAKGIRSLWCKK